MKLYKDVLSQGWILTSRHPQLWVFGLFVVFITGTAGEIDRYLRYVNNLLNIDSVFSIQFWQQQSWIQLLNNAINLISAGNVSVIIFCGLLLGSLLIVAYMIVVAEGGLIYAAGLQGKRRTKTVTFIEAFQAGVKHAFSLFVLNFVSLLVITSLILPMNGLIVQLGDAGSLYDAQISLVLIGSVLLVPLILVISFVVRYAANFIVLEDKDLGSALVQGLQLFLNNWLVTVEMAAVVFVLATVMGIFIILTTFVVIAPYLGLMLIVSPEGEVANVLNVLFVGGTFYVVATLIFAMIFSTWQWVSWTLLFKRIQKEKHTGKTIRLVGAGKIAKK
ncbi:MAG: hypothetical protein Q8P90_04665 [bacterium]|nr:hypothetical protein [bacterium]